MFIYNKNMSTTMTVLNPCIFFVQTEEGFAQKASLDLTEAGYHPMIIPDFSQALAEVEKFQPSMLVIDRTLAGDAGLTLCQQLRKAETQIFIIMLISKETVEERVACLESGADDYLVKPYHQEAFLRLVRFYLQPTMTVKEQLRFRELVLDLTTRRLFLNDKAIDLTMKEFELLKYLMSHPREVLTREQILENVWGYDFQGESNVIEVYIRYLRLKMESEGHKRLIHTVRGVGYVLRES
ncbi:two component transcriptional regulator, winged helix family [Chroococcus sp. FPU101]|nr:two component transcriptional regulator, winged helix family [Chroococcus sp. FPU101]